MGLLTYFIIFPESFEWIFFCFTLTSFDIGKNNSDLGKFTQKVLLYQEA